MLLPSDVVPMPEIDRKSQGFRNVEYAMRLWSWRDEKACSLKGKNNGDSHGLGGGGDQAWDRKESRKRGPPLDWDSDSRLTKRRSTTSDLPSVTAKSLQFAIEAGLVMAVKFTDGAMQPDCPVCTVADALLKLRTEPGKRHHSSPAGDNLMKLTLTLSRRLPATAWRGVGHDHPVVLREYHACQFDALAAELDVFARLEGLQPKVMLCHGVVAARNFSWMALLMEDSAVA
ncbi:hypothetical protein MSAN_01406500 [Mycena sanguinolenta]|uniref:Uncharacterized protein n=1 Tax=Mycena sanguinolenta TaxID=230812 RepID=A0A8H6Y962_9AGAR|nr:hypothetical protein MSAN_01406500 [Mycena sanguinolenta]